VTTHVNPGNPVVFPLGSRVASNFTRYTVKSLEFICLPTAPSTEGGTAACAFESNSNGTLQGPEALASQWPEYDTKMVNGTDGYLHVKVRQSLFRDRMNLLIRTGAEPAEVDSNLMDLGNVYLAYEGNNTIGLETGQWWVKYTFVFHSPKFRPASEIAVYSATAAASGGGTYTNLFPFSTQVHNTSSPMRGAEVFPSSHNYVKVDAPGYYRLRGVVSGDGAPAFTGTPGAPTGNGMSVVASSTSSFLNIMERVVDVLWDGSPHSSNIVTESISGLIALSNFFGNVYSGTTPLSAFWEATSSPLPNTKAIAIASMIRGGTKFYGIPNHPCPQLRHRVNPFSAEEVLAYASDHDRFVSKPQPRPQLFPTPNPNRVHDEEKESWEENSVDRWVR
jgi:hypothetical protein